MNGLPVKRVISLAESEELKRRRRSPLSKVPSPLMGLTCTVLRTMKFDSCLRINSKA